MTGRRHDRPLSARRRRTLEQVGLLQRFRIGRRDRVEAALADRRRLGVRGARRGHPGGGRRNLR